MSRVNVDYCDLMLEIHCCIRVSQFEYNMHCNLFLVIKCSVFEFLRINMCKTSKKHYDLNPVTFLTNILNFFNYNFCVIINLI